MADIRTQSEVWFSGMVQGGGCRYETLKVAKGYEVTGFVENLTDGRVHLVAEGSSSEVAGFIAAVTETLSDYIRETEQRSAPYSNQFESFVIRR